MKDRGRIADEMMHAAAPDINKMNASSNRTTGELLERNSKADADAIRQGMKISAAARWIGVFSKDPKSVLDYIDPTKMIFFVDELAEGRSRIDGYMADFAGRIKSAYELGQAPSCSYDSVFRIPMR